MPAQGTIRLSSEAYKSIAHRAIDSEVKLNQLLDAIILHTDWEKYLPALVTGIKEHRNAPDKVHTVKTEDSAHKLPESTEKVRSTVKVPKMPQEGAERTKQQESLGKFTSKEESHDAEST